MGTVLGVRALLVDVEGFAVNPHATTTTAAGRDVLAHVLASELKLDVIETAHRGHAAEAARDGAELVVIRAAGMWCAATPLHSYGSAASDRWLCNSTATTSANAVRWSSGP